MAFCACPSSSPSDLPPALTPGWGLALEGALEASGSHVGLPGEVFGRRASGWLLSQTLGIGGTQAGAGV